jgi:PPK2 family polyphosphate:nucleotide phosphotransferase
MSKKDQLKKIEKLIEPYKIKNGKGFKLDSIDPSDTRGLGSEQKQEAKELLATGVKWLADLQSRLYADDRWAVLIILQAMDAAGKDGTIKHVMSGVNPQGCQVFAFKQPSAEDLDHDFMWRYCRCMPERGRIGIFNRSYYEEVLVVRVHDLIKKQKLPAKLLTDDIWDERLEDISAIERYLQRNGVLVLKFFLHVSKKEQKRRFLDRIDRADKNWKFSAADMNERQYWKQYQNAFEETIRKTSSKESPWYVVPADNKWFTRLVVAAAIVEALEKLDLSYPSVSKEQMQSLLEAKAALEKD